MTQIEKNLEDVENDSNNLVSVDTRGSMWDKCPTHETQCAETWEEIIKDFPTIKDDDIIDVYIFKNGVLLWPKNTQ